MLLAPAAVRAQQIRGVVVEDMTDTPIPGVTVELLAEDSTIRASAVTASTGWFQLPTGSAGRFLLRTSHPVFTAGALLEVVVQQREIVTIVLRMSGGAIPLEPLVVTARSHDRLSGFRERAQRSGFGRYITREQIDERPAARPSDLLRMVPEVRIELVRDPSGVFTSNAVLMRSFGELCAPAIYLDGMPIPQDFGFDIDDLISTELIEGVEIYRSYVGAPLEFHLPQNTCGVIAFWSRTIRGRPLSWKSFAIAGVLAGIMVLMTR